MEIKKVVTEEYIVEYKCDVCKTGYLRSNGYNGTTDKHKHKCLFCEAEIEMSLRYPYLLHQTADDVNYIV